MLLGEHAVLHGKHAIVAAVDQRLHVYLTPRKDAVISIESALGHYESLLDQLTVEAPFTFVLSVIHRFAQGQMKGFDLRIDSEFSSTIGLGSSAAVLVATAAAVMRYWKVEGDLFETCYRSLIEVQGRGSGADLAAAIQGGIVLFKGANPLRLPLVRGRGPTIESIREPPSLTGEGWGGFALRLVYSGYKTPTAEVIAIVDAARQKDPETFAHLFDQIDKAVLAGAEALRTQNWAGFAAAMDRNQVLMEKLGVCDETLSRMIADLKKEPHVLSAKISGSGLGDCVYGLLQPGSCSLLRDHRMTGGIVMLSNDGVLFHD